MCSLPFVVECCCKNEENRCRMLLQERGKPVYWHTAEGGGIGGQGYSPPLFQICDLRGLASHCVNLGTLVCNTTQI